VRPYLEKHHHKIQVGGVAQSAGPEFKPQYHKKKKKRESCPLSLVSNSCENFIAGIL
jgi:hypothetical protein